jgi:hypothetical protein
MCDSLCWLQTQRDRKGLGRYTWWRGGEGELTGRSGTSDVPGGDSRLGRWSPALASRGGDNPPFICASTPQVLRRRPSPRGTVSPPWSSPPAGHQIIPRSSIAGTSTTPKVLLRFSRRRAPGSGDARGCGAVGRRRDEAAAARFDSREDGVPELETEDGRGRSRRRRCGQGPGAE